MYFALHIHVVAEEEKGLPAKRFYFVLYHTSRKSGCQLLLLLYCVDIKSAHQLKRKIQPETRYVLLQIEPTPLCSIVYVSRVNSTMDHVKHLFFVGVVSYTG